VTSIAVFGYIGRRSGFESVELMYDQRAIKRYEEGRKFHHKGKLSEAERAYKKAIKISPEFSEAYNNLGNVLMDKSRPREAADAYRRALKHLSDHPMLLNNLGNALQALGDNEKAVEWFHKALQQDSNYAQAHNNLGNALRDLGQLQQAEASYRRATEIDPGQADALNNLAGILFESGRLNEAIDSFHKVIAIDPGHVGAHTALGFALIEKGSDTQAIEAFQKALQLDPRQADAQVGLGNALSKLGEFDRALESYQQALKLDPENLNAHNCLGRFNSDINELDKAIGCYQTAIDLDPTHKESFKNLAEVFAAHGRLDEAIDYCRKAIEIDSGYAEAYRLLSRIRKFSEYDDDIQAMQSLFAKDGISDSDKMQVGFGLGKAYEDIGDYEKSMLYILDGSRLKRLTFNYSVSKSRELFERIKKVFTREFFGGYEMQGNTDETPIFILGMPRSGTSLVEQILASHPDVHGGGELVDLMQVLNLAHDRYVGSNIDEFPEFVTRLEPRDLRELGCEYVSRIRKLSPNARFITDKMPHNFLRIGFIRMILPNARIINCCRDPMDNCLSIFKNYFPSGHDYSYDLTELGQYYNLYLDLMRHWKSTLPGFIYELSYQDLVIDQEKQIRQLLEHCHLPWNDACLDFYKTERLVNTASNAQVRQPIYKDSVMRWKRYEKQLKPLADVILGE